MEMASRYDVEGANFSVILIENESSFPSLFLTFAEGNLKMSSPLHYFFFPEDFYYLERVEKLNGEIAEGCKGPTRCIDPFLGKKSFSKYGSLRNLNIENESMNPTSIRNRLLEIRDSQE